MNIEEIKMVLAKKKGAFPLTIVTETIPKLKGSKKCPMLSNGPITKMTTVNGMANWLYENAVNKQKQREGQKADFVSHPRKWGARLSLPTSVLPFVHHIEGLVQPSHKEIPNLDHLPSTDELYLELKCQNVYDVKYFQNDKEIDKSVLIPYLPVRNDGDRQEVENVVILRDYKLTNIKELRMDGRVYNV